VIPGLPRDGSVSGHLVDDLLYVTDRYDVFVVAVLAGILVLFSLYFHARRTPSSERGDTRYTPWKILGVALAAFGIVDGYLFGASMRALDHALWNVAAAEERADVVRIELNAQQWSWAFRYAGPDGAFNTADDALTLNDLRVPVGKPVVLEMGATDVVHSFSLPNFRIKQDVVPGQLTQLTFEPQLPGSFEIVCQQMCGVNHYKMRGVLTVMEPAAYARWLAEASEHSKRGYDPADGDAHWGWTWRGAK
jgi:cytochrome c oxidase subunit 2